MLKWRKAASCEAGADPRECWCEPGREGKCWLRSTATEAVPHILKGGEDFDRLRGGDPAGLLQHRLLRRAVLGQPPDRPARRRPAAAQLRADAVRHRPVPARLRVVPGDRGPARGAEGLLPVGAAERPVAGAGPRLAGGAGGDARRRVFPRRGRARARGLRGDLRELPFEPAGAVRGRGLPGDRSGRPDARLDWLGNDEVVPASEIGTYAARSLHSNHMPGRVWAEYASLDAHARPADPTRPEVMKGGGRGYYRNISLLSAWAHAPFMHNNAIGPEILRQARRGGARLLFLALRRRGSEAAGESAGLLGVRSERRGPLRALQGVDGGAAEPGPAGAEGVRPRPADHRRHRAGGVAARARPRADGSRSRPGSRRSTSTRCATRT